MQSFSAQIRKAGINPCVAVPKRISKAFGIRGYVPVKARLNKTSITAMLVPIGGFRHRLYINGFMMKAAQVRVGDTIRLQLRIDTASRELPMPADLAAALGSKLAAFNNLTPSRRKEIIRYYGFLKNPGTKKKLIVRVIALLNH